MLAQTRLQNFEGCRTTHCECPRIEQKLSKQTTRVCLLMLIVYIWRGCYRSFVGKDQGCPIIYRRTQTLRIRLSRNATCCSWALTSMEFYYEKLCQIILSQSRCQKQIFTLSVRICMCILNFLESVSLCLVFLPARAQLSRLGRFSERSRHSFGNTRLESCSRRVGCKNPFFQYSVTRNGQQKQPFLNAYNTDGTWAP